MTIEHRKVSSSNIASWGYDSTARVIEVRFTSGALHRYHDVPPEAAESFTKAESVGSHFARSIRPFYKGEKVDETRKVPEDVKP